MAGDGADMDVMGVCSSRFGHQFNWKRHIANAPDRHARGARIHRRRTLGAANGRAPGGFALFPGCGCLLGLRALQAKSTLIDQRPYPNAPSQRAQVPSWP